MNLLNRQGDMCVHVIAPARLHMGFIDMHGGLGRHFGSLGLSLSEIFTEISAYYAPEVSAEGPDSERAAACATRLLDHLDINTGVKIKLKQAIPSHAGLGSGTQISLAVGMAIARLYNLDISVRELAAILDRGNRSGIGIGAFMHGGFIVDGGRCESTVVPPIISHMNLPEAWRYILIFDKSRKGIEGEAEKEAFKRLPAMNGDTVANLCRLVLMQVLPAIAESNCQKFGMAITQIQQIIGGYFSEAQDGIYNSAGVERVLPLFVNHGATGVGQSSWGPTGFAIFSNETNAYQALKQAKENQTSDSCLEFMLCRARNKQAEIWHSNDMRTNNVNERISK